MSFVSVMKAIGHDFKKVFEFLLYNPYAQIGESVAFNVALPGLGPMFNATKSAVLLAEAKYAALGQQKMGPAKLGDVLQLMEPVIAQGLADAGQSNKAQDVINYINAVVQIMNTTPAPTGSPINVPGN